MLLPKINAYIHIFLISSINNNASQLDKHKFLITDIKLLQQLKNSKCLKIYSANIIKALVRNDNKQIKLY